MTTVLARILPLLRRSRTISRASSVMRLFAAYSMRSHCATESPPGHFPSSSRFSSGHNPNGSLYETHLHADPILPAGLKWHQSHSTPAVRVPGVGVRKASPRLLPLEGRLAAVPAVSAASAHTRRR